MHGNLTTGLIASETSFLLQKNKFQISFNFFIRYKGGLLIARYLKIDVRLRAEE